MDEHPIVLSRVVVDADDVVHGAAAGEVRLHSNPQVTPTDFPRARHVRPSRLRIATTVGADAVALTATATLAVWLAAAFHDTALISRFITPFEYDPHGGVLVFIVLTPYWLAVLWAFGLYREPGRSIGGMNLAESMGGLTALTTASWAVLIVMIFFAGPFAPVPTLIVFWMLAVFLVPAARWICRTAVWSSTAFQERVLIIGAGQVGHTLAAKIGKHAEYRMNLIGFLDDGEPRPTRSGEAHVPIIGALSDLSRVVAEKRIDRVIVAFSKARHNDFLHVVRACGDSDVRVNIVPRLFEVVSSQAVVDDVEGIPLLDVAHAELSRFNMTIKRGFDLVIGGLLCVVILPVLAVLGIIIKLDSRGPVFYRQERTGCGGKTFMIFKLRTMCVDADKQRRDLAGQNDYDGPMFKMHEDPRITRSGHWLRRWSLDELPQILNVMNGDMSLVGPRPLWVEEAKQCRGWTQKRLDITPGITGLWQVLGRSDIPFEEMVKLDYMYVTGWSLSWDIKLLLQTLPAVLQKRGAY